jgi:AcrR family transcriptional regulator
MADETARTRPGGRAARVRRAVLDATVEAIRDHGFETLAIKDIATRAGVHETSIYRRWGTREALIIDGLLEDSGQNVPVPDTGSLRTDLTEFAGRLAAYLDSAHGRALMHLLITSDDPAVASVRGPYLEARFGAVSTIIHRAIQRGETAASTDPRLVLETLIGPLHFRALVMRQRSDIVFIDRLVGLVIDGLSQPASSGGQVAL